MNRVLILACAGVFACGGAPARPDRPTADRCDRYARVLAPALGRIAKAADQFMDRISARSDESARAARDLVERLAAEKAQLEGIGIGSRELEARHARLIGALGGLGGAVRGLADAIGTGDREAGRRAQQALGQAVTAWDEATQGIRQLCPQAGGTLEAEPPPQPQ